MRKSVIAASVALLGWAVGTAYANPQRDSLTVTITPTAAYSIVLATTTSGLNLGTVALNSSTSTVNPSTVTITSSYATTGLKLTGQITGAGTPWTFETTDATLPAADKLGAWVVFTDTSVASNVALGAGNGQYFRGSAPGANSCVVDTTQRAIGTYTGGPSYIAVAGQAGYKTMASLPSNTVDLAASRAHIWMYFQLPPTTTDTNAKNVTFTIAAGAPNP